MSAARLPATCAVAFKEWAGVCRALAEGRQSLILRKGGIEEGPGGFTPEHPAFWLYPTHLHESQQGLVDPTPPPHPTTPPGAVALEALAVVEAVAFCDRPEALEGLRELHVWTDETVLKRFHYRRPGLWVLGVRVWRRAEPHRVAVTPEQAGCKSWVPLPAPLTADGLAPAIDDEESDRRLGRLRAALAAPA